MYRLVCELYTMRVLKSKELYLETSMNLLMIILNHHIGYLFLTFFKYLKNKFLKPFINLKRNHSLFGSVWSSMRRRTGSLRRSFRVSNTHSKKKHVSYVLDKLKLKFLRNLNRTLNILILLYLLIITSFLVVV